MVAEPRDEAAFLFDPTTLHEWDLRLSEADLARLDADPVAEEWVKGSLVFQGMEYGPVAIRYKGSMGSLGLSWIAFCRSSRPSSYSCW